ncbi:MAG: hypothetical protein HY043_16110 [Verrucomicrobia bacterium]|nr:hypothetical protein [Verrucomicrobiota bacterium]
MKTQRPAPSTAPSKTPSATSPVPLASLVQRHLRVGWWTLLIFLTAGLALEALHGFKVGAYLKVSNETRRLMWTLAHAHGTLLGLVNLAFAMTTHVLRAWPERSQRLASAALLAATVLMPAGFFLGGVFIYAGDPGLGILLVPVGGILLFIAVLQTASALKYFNVEKR